MALADKLRALTDRVDNLQLLDTKENMARCDSAVVGLRALAIEVEKLTKAVVAFDTILFPDDQDRDPVDTIHMRDQLVTDLADAMDRHGWAGTLEENVDLIDRLTTRRGFDGLG